MTDVNGTIRALTKQFNFWNAEGETLFSVREGLRDFESESQP